MMNFDPENPDAKTSPHTDDQRWKRLFENIRRIALKKSDAMMNSYFADEEDFDRDARILRTLMGSAEIAARMRRQDEKEKELDDERPEPRPRTDEEIRTIYRHVAGLIDAEERAERARTAQERADQKGDAHRSGKGRGKGLGEKCS